MAPAGEGHEIRRYWRPDTPGVMHPYLLPQLGMLQKQEPGVKASNRECLRNLDARHYCLQRVMWLAFVPSIARIHLVQEQQLHARIR